MYFSLSPFLAKISCWIKFVAQESKKSYSLLVYRTTKWHLIHPIIQVDTFISSAINNKYLISHVLPPARSAVHKQ